MRKSVVKKGLRDKRCTYVVRAHECTVCITNHRRTPSVLVNKNDQEKVDSKVCSKRNVDEPLIPSPMSTEVQNCNHSNRYLEHHGKDVAACDTDLSCPVRKYSWRNRNLTYKYRVLVTIFIPGRCCEPRRNQPLRCLYG